MCKVLKVIELINDRAELLEIKALVEERLKLMRPFRIMEVLKTCGKEDCSCQDNLDQRHGPYLIAAFVEDGRQRQKNLGRKYLEAEFRSMAQDGAPSWFNFVVKKSVYEKVKEDERYERGWTKRLLKAQEFEEFYGIHHSEDKFDRPYDLYYSYRRYSIEVGRWSDKIDVLESEFRAFGVGTQKGVAILRGLLSRGYYLANEKGDLCALEF